MTTICAYKHPGTGQVTIGGDSLAFSGDFRWPETVRKWVVAGHWFIGCTGNAKTISLLRAKAAEAARYERPEEVADWVVGVLAAAGYRNIRKDEEPGAPDYGQELLLASANGVWAINGDGFVSGPSWGFLAAGSGAEYAYGAAYAMRGSDSVVFTALKAAVEFDAHTGGELLIEIIE